MQFSSSVLLVGFSDYKGTFDNEGHLLTVVIEEVSLEGNICRFDAARVPAKLRCLQLALDRLLPLVARESSRYHEHGPI